jgi:tRNA threonylcarbamoyladenosine biosynthesis protein TsaB
MSIPPQTDKIINKVTKAKEWRWLAFDTSTDVLSLAVARGPQVWTQTLPGGAQASSGLIPAVLAMLAEADMPLASLDAIVFGRGPGSFTGLRTACAVAQGLAFGADIPVLPVDTLLAVAEEARYLQAQSGMLGSQDQDSDQQNAHDHLTVLALLDARMDEVYSATYRWQAVTQQPVDDVLSDVQGHWHALGALQVGAPEKVKLPEPKDGQGELKGQDQSQGQVTGQEPSQGQANDVLLAGNAFAAYGDRLPAGPRCHALPTAMALLRLAPALWAQGLAVPADQAMPLYIRDKVANTTAEREVLKAQASAQAAAAQLAAPQVASAPAVTQASAEVAPRIGPQIAPPMPDKV